MFWTFADFFAIALRCISLSHLVKPCECVFIKNVFLLWKKGCVVLKIVVAIAQEELQFFYDVVFF